MSLDSEFKVGTQYLIYSLQAAQTVIFSELICHSHLTKCQYMTVLCHTSVTPPYLPIQICNLATNSWQQKLTSFRALFCVKNCIWHYFSWYCLIATLNWKGILNCRAITKLSFYSFFWGGDGFGWNPAASIFECHTCCETMSKPGGNDLT